ncbi:DUF2339 domain-containing protein [Nocardia seriolae]|nr:DUF2339 domain-containing protein [Nocardia seriolae]WKY52859.1 DUF2339 domain-containing protein [Nocardia seriolae]WNJ59072.1 DUF2339 domain-containing protein [Nocardia seriolae]BAW10583.1 conserved hypothetical protein [Nocardia seriolae]BEK99329.1 hypothetical protein NSER024013_72350 [Nocardia seriolae]GEM23265.1 hypothetical protein NS2_15040 [Nocardia seriolae NBRC 15557]
MNLAIDPRLIARLSTEFTSLGERLNVLGRDLDTLRCQVIAENARIAPTRTTPPVTAPPVTGESMPPAAQPAPAPVPGGIPPTTSAIPPVPEATPWASPVPGGEHPVVARGVSAAAAAAQSANIPAAGPIPQPPAAPTWSTPAGTMGPTPPIPPAAGWGPVPAPITGAVAGPGSAPGAGPIGMGAPVGQGIPGGAGAARPGWMAAGAPQPGYRPMPPVPPQRRSAYARPIRAPWWQREGVISRVLAVAGVAVTLIGVVMLLVLAAQAGFFGPVPRVVAGALFSGALVFSGTRVNAKAGGRVGGIALAATGIAGGYLDVIAMTTMYHWLHPVVGYVVALGIAAGGVALAVQWRSQALAVMVMLGAALLAPFVTTELALLGFLIVLQIAALPVQSVRDWPGLHFVRTIPAVLATLVAVAASALGLDTDRTPASDRFQVLAAAIVIAIAGLVGAVLAVRKRAGDIAASLSFAAAVVPMLAAPIMFGRTGSVIVSAAVAAVLLVVAALPWLPTLGAALQIPGQLAVVAGLAGAFALLEACIGVTRVQTLPLALSVVAMGFLAVAGQQRSRITAGIGAGYGALGVLTFAFRADPATLAAQSEAEAHLGMSTALSALAILAVLVVAGWSGRRLGLLDRESDATVLSVFAGMGGLYAVTVLTVSLGVATGDPNGFRAGHAIATVVWMAAATAALLFGLRRLSRSPQRAKVALGAGLLVTAAALAKLFLFDLATLDGLVRAAAFLVVGVLLLLVGTRYARAFADLDSRPPTP